MNLLNDWGGSHTKRQLTDETLIPQELALNSYEAGRPSEEEAIRLGGEQILADDGYQVRDRSLYEGIGNVRAVPMDGRKLFKEK